jgi:RNA polymerase sigma factor (sigma-70 family)
VKNKAEFWRREKRAVAREQPRRDAGDTRGASFSDCYATMITPSRHLLAREEIERFERSFEALPEDHREVISLARIVGLSHKEVGEQMGRSEEATRQLLRRALAGLALALERPRGDVTRPAPG